jgi:beta-xylosidase
MFNDIVDPQYDWPLTDRNLSVYINDKYSANGAASNPTKSGIAWAQSNIKTYYKIVTRVNSNPTKDTIVEKIEVDANTYANVSVTTATYILQDTNRITESITKQPLYYYDYETEVNEGKRKITLLKDTFVTGTGATLMDEFKRIITLGE